MSLSSFVPLWRFRLIFKLSPNCSSAVSTPTRDALWWVQPSLPSPPAHIRRMFLTYVDVVVALGHIGNSCHAGRCLPIGTNDRISGPCLKLRDEQPDTVKLKPSKPRNSCPYLCLNRNTVVSDVDIKNSLNELKKVFHFSLLVCVIVLGSFGLSHYRIPLHTGTYLNVIILMV